MKTLFASGNQFLLHEASSNCYLEASDILNNLIPPLLTPFSGFTVVKGLFEPSSILHLRDQYFGSFEDGSYSYYDCNWHHNFSSFESHGTGNHPAASFVNSPDFLKFISTPSLRHISAFLLRSSSALLCPRAIVRSFSYLSNRCTFAHRDCEYFKVLDTTKAITAWIPLGPADFDSGQLIYLNDSHLFSDTIQSYVRTDRTLSSNLQSFADQFNLSWVAPVLDLGDVVFHCLHNVHASFDTHNVIPRLSCDLRFSADPSSVDPRWGNTWRGDDGL